jgi:hypothetical protein
MNDEIEAVKNPLRDASPADAAHSPAVECRADPTLAELVAMAQRGWSHFRDAQLHVLAAAVPLLRFAEAQQKVFRACCDRVLREIKWPRKEIDPARASLETLAFALQVSQDPDARSLTRSQRAEYASGLGWFAHLCPETDPDKAVALARRLGQLAGIASRYRKHKDENDPSRQQRLSRARMTRSRPTTGDSGSTTSPEDDSPVSPGDGTQAERHEISLSARDDAVGAPATPGGEEPAADPLCVSDEHHAGEQKVEADPIESVELPVEVTNIAGLVRLALDKPERARCLVDELWVLQGISPTANPAPSVSDQRVLAWLQVNGLFFGPVRDASICTAIAERFVIDHLQYQQRWGGQSLAGVN